MTRKVGGCVTTPLALPALCPASGCHGALADRPAFEISEDATASNRRLPHNAAVMMSANLPRALGVLADLICIRVSLEAL